VPRQGIFLPNAQQKGQNTSDERKENAMAAETAKQAAGVAAAKLVQDGMTIGLGSGSTAACFIAAVGERIRNEGLRVQGIAPSVRSENLALQHGIPLVELTPDTIPDLAVDGTDEADAALNLIKGGGGALAREKIVAVAAKEFIVIADRSKRVPTLGRFPLPVAVFPFGWQETRARIVRGFAVPAALRMVGDAPFLSDDGMYIFDLPFGEIPHPANVEEKLNNIPGVAACGLFIGMASRLILGDEAGDVQEYVRE
jgi:ribose 5-phosphate isomerase A